MSKRSHNDQPPSAPRRRDFLRQGATLGIAGAVAPRFALAQADDLAPYRAAKINCRPTVCPANAPPARAATA